LGFKAFMANSEIFATSSKPTRARRTRVGVAPGTLIADPNAQPSRLTLTLISPDECRTVEGATVADIQAHRGEWPLVWLDFVGLADTAMIAEVGAIFDLHALALEDVVNTGQRPKVEFFDEHAFFVLRMIDDPASNRYEQMTIFFGADFVVSFQERQGDPFGQLRKRLNTGSDSKLHKRKGDYLAYALIDSIVDSYFPPLEATTDTVEMIEDEMLRETRKDQARRLHALRRSVITVKRALWPLRDALAGLIRSEAGYVTAETKLYLNDTLDHSIRLIDMVETNRDMLGGLIDMHLALSQARTNDIISFLTIVSAIFIPLTFLAGIWGMNFDPNVSPWNMPELEAYYGYPAALLLMLAVALAMVAYFRWKKWL
jgi:magnesium transporter